MLTKSINKIVALMLCAFMLFTAMPAVMQTAEAASVVGETITGYAKYTDASGNSLSNGTWNPSSNTAINSNVLGNAWTAPADVDRTHLYKEDNYGGTTTWTPNIGTAKAGWYQVSIFVSTHSSYEGVMEAPVTINNGTSYTKIAVVDQTKLGTAAWIDLGEYEFSGNGSETVSVAGTPTKQFPIIAIRLTGVEAPDVVKEFKGFSSNSSGNPNSLTNGTWTNTLGANDYVDPLGSSWTQPDGMAAGSFDKLNLKSSTGTATYTPNLTAGDAGNYHVSVYFGISANGTYAESMSGAVTINHSGGVNHATATIKSSVVASHDWIDLGVYSFSGDGTENIIISNADTGDDRRLAVVGIKLTEAEETEIPQMMTVIGYPTGTVGTTISGLNGVWNFNRSNVSNTSWGFDGAQIGAGWTVPDGVDVTKLRKLNVYDEGSYARWLPYLYGASGTYNISVFLCTTANYSEGMNAQVKVSIGETSQIKDIAITKIDKTQGWIDAGEFELTTKINGDVTIDIVNAGNDNKRISVAAIRLTPLPSSIKIGDDTVAVNELENYVFDTTSKAVPVSAVNLTGYNVTFNGIGLNDSTPITADISLGLDKINIAINDSSYGIFTVKPEQIMYHDEGEVDPVGSSAVTGVTGYNGTSVIELNNSNITFTPAVTSKAKLYVYGIVGSGDFSVSVNGGAAISKTSAEGWMEIGEYNFTSDSTVVIAATGTCYVNAVKVAVTDEILYTAETLVKGTEAINAFEAGNIKAEVYAYNNSASSKDIMLALGIYSDEATVLDEVKVTNATVETNKVQKLSTEAITVSTVEGKNAKAFLWMQNTLKPIGNGIIIRK